MAESVLHSEELSEMSETNEVVRGQDNCSAAEQLSCGEKAQRRGQSFLHF